MAATGTERTEVVADMAPRRGESLRLTAATAAVLLAGRVAPRAAGGIRVVEAVTPVAVVAATRAEGITKIVDVAK